MIRADVSANMGSRFFDALPRIPVESQDHPFGQHALPNGHDADVARTKLADFHHG
jgi:hypothetical protein